MSLPLEIGSLQGLQKLNVSHNKLSVLPVEMFKLSNLRQLKISHNCLGEINAELNDLVMLEVLVSSLKYNIISFILYFSFQDLSHNQIIKLRDGIGFLVRLQTLTLSHNKLKQLPDDIVNMRSEFSFR